MRVPVLCWVWAKHSANGGLETSVAPARVQGEAPNSPAAAERIRLSPKIRAQLVALPHLLWPSWPLGSFWAPQALRLAPGCPSEPSLPSPADCPCRPGLRAWPGCTLRQTAALQGGVWSRSLSEVLGFLPGTHCSPGTYPSGSTFRTRALESRLGRGGQGGGGLGDGKQYQHPLGSQGASLQSCRLARLSPGPVHTWGLGGPLCQKSPHLLVFSGPLPWP